MGNQARKTGGYLASVLFAFAAGAAAIFFSDKKKRAEAKKRLVSLKGKLLETKEKLVSKLEPEKPKEGNTQKNKVSKPVKK